MTYSFGVTYIYLIRLSMLKTTNTSPTKGKISRKLKDECGSSRLSELGLRSKMCSFKVCIKETEKAKGEVVKLLHQETPQSQNFLVRPL